jgi:hypothetical protein
MLGLASHIYKFPSSATVIMQIAPNEIDKLIGWFDFSDKSTLFQDTAGFNPVTTNGQSIGRIYNKAHSSLGLYNNPNGVNSPINLFMAAIDNARRPTYNFNFGGHAVFDGTDDFLASAGNAGQFETGGQDPGSNLVVDIGDMAGTVMDPAGADGGNGMTIIALVKGAQSSTSSDEYILGLSGSYGSDAASLNVLRDTGGEGLEFKLYIDSGTSQTDVITDSTAINNNTREFAVVTQAGSNASHIYLDNGLANSSQAGTIDANGGGNAPLRFITDNCAMTIGKGLDEVGEEDGEEWEGRIHEIIMYNKPLSGDELQGIGAYLATKYNL